MCQFGHTRAPSGRQQAAGSDKYRAATAAAAADVDAEQNPDQQLKVRQKWMANGRGAWLYIVICRPTRPKWEH